MGKKRGPYSSERQLNRRLRILRAAGEHLEQHGESSITMQSIAEVSGVATKTLYNLFGSRDELLLEAGSERLVDLGLSDFVTAAEAGLPRLLAYTVGSMRQFEEMPKYARSIISILVRSDLPTEQAFQQFGVVQRFALKSLEIAATQGELRSNLALDELANHIAANQWGAVLWWEKGLIALEELETHVRLSHYMTLIPVSVGARRQQMKAELDKMLADRFTHHESTAAPVFDISARRKGA